MAKGMEKSRDTVVNLVTDDGCESLVVCSSQAAIVAQRKKKLYFDKAPYVPRPIAFSYQNPDLLSHITLRTSHSILENQNLIINDSIDNP